MKKFLIIFMIAPFFAVANQDGLFNFDSDSITVFAESTEINQDNINPLIQKNIISKRLQELDVNSPMDLVYNDQVKVFIDSYLGKNKALISRMKGLSLYYFPIIERELDLYDLPLEFKYLAIVESALNPKARSRSGACGLWQFMYLTGKQYGLEVNSYVDERQDPLKSTKSACEYFVSLYDTFGDWNLVLAAYNGGPGYLQRKILSVGSSDFWQLYPHLRKETRNYIPTFIAVNYAMQYSHEHDITIEIPKINFGNIDTLILKKKVELKTLTQLLCVNEQTINYLNPSYKKSIFPEGAILTLPIYAVNDFKLNEITNYAFIDAVKNKEILIDEERIVYSVNKGDYLGRIAKAHNVKIFEIKEWNRLKSTNLDIGDKLVIFVQKDDVLKGELKDLRNNEYIIKKGDTLWDIAQKYNGLSVWKIKALNNMENDILSPGTTILLPTS